MFLFLPHLSLFLFYFQFHYSLFFINSFSNIYSLFIIIIYVQFIGIPIFIFLSLLSLYPTLCKPIIFLLFINIIGDPDELPNGFSEYNKLLSFNL